jgi:hypothetical protein
MMNSLIPVKEHPSLLRDKNSKALINTDIAALNEYKNKKKLTEDVRVLSEEMQDIKRLLNQIVDSLNKDK